MKKALRALLTLIVLVSCSVSARGTVADTCIYLLNIYPGSEIYELEGHSAIALTMPGRPAIAFNYGVFDFNRPNFVYRFVKGETDYMAVAWPLEAFLSSYDGSGRRIVAHELNLDSGQKKRLVEMLFDNVRPENATYRYNYVLNNCATRPLAVVERAVGDSLVFGPAPFEANSSLPVTFRNVMRSYHANYPWYQFGIDLALGSGIDRPVDSRALTFAPAELDRMLDHATAGGKQLVSRSHVIVDTAPEAGTDGPTPWYLTPICVCSLILLLAIALTVRDIRRHRESRWFDAVFFGAFGLTGCLLTFLIFVSTHEATSPNWLYIWLNPISLLVPVMVWFPACRRVLECYYAANLLALVLLCVCWYWIPQSGNVAFVPLIAADMLRSASYLVVNHGICSGSRGRKGCR